MALWFKSDAWEAASFKRAPEGWIFQSPISWTFGLGPGRHYLLSETQKAEIATIFGRTDWRYLTGAAAVGLLGAAPIVLLVWVVPVLGNDPALNLWLAIFLTAIWAQGVVNVACWLMLRSTLAEARRTSERITFVERLNATAAIMPIALLIMLAVVNVWAFGFSTYEVLSGTWNVGSLATMVLAGPFALYICAMLAMKLKAKPTAG